MTDSLQRHYPLLSKQERLTVYLRAVGRGDQTERDAVIAASPYFEMQMRDFFPELDALQTMNLLHLLVQMDALLGVMLFIHGADQPEAQWRAAQFMAQEFLNTQEAWRVFADEYGLAPDKLLNGLSRPLLRFFSTCRSEPLVERVARWDEGCEDDGAVRLVPTSVPEKVADLRQTFEALVKQAA